MGRTVQELTYKLVADEKALVAGLKTAGERAEKFGRKMQSVGNSMTKGLTLPAAAAGAGMLKLASDAGQTADRLLDLEQSTGLSTDTLQQFEGVAKGAGVEFSGLVGAVERFQNRLPRLESGTSNGAQAIEKLGVDLRDSNGNVKDANNLFPELIDALSGMENVTERNATASQIFGRQLQDLAPVIGMSAAELEKWRDVGAESAIPKETLQANNEFRQSLDEMQLRLERAKTEIGSELIPVVEDLVPIFEDAAMVVVDALRAFTDLDEGTQNLILGIAGITAVAGPALSAFGKIATGARSVAGAARVMWTALTGPVGLAVAGLTAVVGIVAKVGKNMYDASQAAEKFGDASEQLQKDFDISAGKLSDIGDTFRELYTQGKDLDVIVQSISREYGKTEKEVAEILRQSEIITDEDREQLGIRREINNELAYATDSEKELQASRQQRLSDAEQNLKQAQRMLGVRRQEKESIEEQIEQIEGMGAYASGAQRAKLDSLREELETRKRQITELEREVPLRQKALERQQELQESEQETLENNSREREQLQRKNEQQSALLEKLQNIDELQRHGGIRETEALERKKELRESMIDTLREEQELGKITTEDASRRIQQMLAAIARYEARLADLQDSENENADKEKGNIEELKAAQAQYYNARRLGEKELSEAWEKARRERLNDLKTEIQQTVQQFQQGFQAVDGVVQQHFKNRRQELENWEQRRRQEIERTIDDEDEKQKAIERLERKKRIKQAEMERKQAIYKKASDLAQTAISTASAVAEALPNIPLATFVGTMGAAQAALIAAQPLPEVPKFATGGSFTVPPGYSDDSYPLPAAMVQSGERVTVETPEQQAAGAGGEDQSMTLQLMIDGKMMAERTVDYINNGQVRLEVAG